MSDLAEQTKRGVDPGLAWFALRTTSQYEFMVRNILRRRGLLAFIKTEQRLRRKTKRDPVRRKQTFCAAPSYCFVGLPTDAPHPWALVHGMHMVRSVVSLNGRPAQLNPVALSSFLGYDDYAAPDHFKHFKTGQQEFSPGDMVRIASPAFEDLTLPVKDIENGEVIFSLVLMGRITEFRVALEQVYKAA